MYQKGNEKWKWIGVICVVGVIGFFLWQNQLGKVEDEWLVSMSKQRGELGAEGGVAGGGERDRAGEEGLSPSVQPVAEPKLAVHIAGGVQQPGVYFLPLGSRVVDLVKKAGGVLKSADLNQVNLAQPLADGQKVVIPLRMAGGGGSLSAGVSSGGWTGPSTGGGSSGGSGSSSGSRSGKVNINSASKEELQRLSGVGPSRADSIIQYRTEHGSFRKLEDLMKISGIGEKTFAKLKDQITLY